MVASSCQKKISDKGFNDTCLLALTIVSGGQSVLNPWPIIGGVAKSIVTSQDYILPEHGEINDVLLLTKPIGTQVSVNIHEWKLNKEERYNDLINNNIITDDDEQMAYNISTGSMMRLNRTASLLMHKYNTHGATDVTGFGLKGHLSNLFKQQKNSIVQKNGCFRIHTLPIIHKMLNVHQYCNEKKIRNFRLDEGFAAETSGGLLIMISPKKMLNIL